MAKKATITPVTDTVNNAAAINTQLNAINNQLDNTLSLDGSVPNAMGADLDMNSNDILNVNTLAVADLTVGGLDVNTALNASVVASAASATAASTSATAASLSATQAAQYDGIWLDDVAALLADTTLTYTAGQPSTVVVGDYVRTRKEGFAYQVAASGDVATAGGIQLDVLAGDNGYNVKAFGAVGDGVADDTAAIQATLNLGATTFIPLGTYNVSDTLFTKSNGIKVHGENGKAYSGGKTGTALFAQFTTDDKPILDVFNGAGAAGGQLVTIEDIVFRGTQNFIALKLAGTPETTGPIGIYGGDTTTGDNTKDSFEIRRCTFRTLKKAFTLKGWIHYVDDCYINNCYEAYDITSTQSSTVSRTVVQTTVNQWGTLSGVKHVDCTIQQGNELQALVQNKGFVCAGYVSFENCFFEGGSNQIFLNDGVTAEVLNCFMGFTILAGGGYGHCNFRTGVESSLWVRGGRKGGVSSFLVNGADNASVVWLDFAEPYTESIQSASNVLQAPTFKIVRPYAVHERTNYQNKINYTRLSLTDGTAHKLFNLTNATSGKHNGWLKVGIHMSSSYDLYEVSFAYSSSLSVPASTINTIQRNTGGSGTNNVTLAVDGSYNVTVTRNKAETCLVWLAVESYGYTNLIDPAAL